MYSAKELSKFEETFKYFDRLGLGYMKREDLPFALRAMGFLITTVEAREIGAYLDPGRT